MDTRRALLEKYLGDLEAAAAAKLAAAPKLPDGVVRIQAGRAGRTPFFFLHGQYDSAGFYCYRLAESLDSDQPFYALDSYQFGDAPAPPSLEEMAAAHVAAVREVAPHGPYILGGWCAGGLLAFEMARQMAAAGERVEHLFLLDPVYLRYPAWLRLARGAVQRGASSLSRPATSGRLHPLRRLPSVEPARPAARRLSGLLRLDGDGLRRDRPRGGPHDADLVDQPAIADPRPARGEVQERVAARRARARRRGAHGSVQPLDGAQRQPGFAGEVDR